MRFTLFTLLLVALAGCAAAPVSMSPAPPAPDALDRLDAPVLRALAQDEFHGPPAPETLRTEPDLPREETREEKRARSPALAHFRAEIQGGAFLDDTVSDFYDSAWGLGVSGGVFLNEHVSVGGMLDFLGSYEEIDYYFNNQKIGTQEFTLTMLTFSPMVWLHLTPASDVKNDLTPSLAVGAGPSVVLAYEEVETDTILGDFDDDEDDVGWGFQAEIVGEVPLGSSLTLAGGARYAMRRTDKFRDLDAIVGFLGLGVRF